MTAKRLLVQLFSLFGRLLCQGFFFVVQSFYNWKPWKVSLDFFLNQTNLTTQFIGPLLLLSDWIDITYFDLFY